MTRFKIIKRSKKNKKFFVESFFVQNFYKNWFSLANDEKMRRRRKLRFFVYFYSRIIIFLEFDPYFLFLRSFFILYYFRNLFSIFFSKICKKWDRRGRCRRGWRQLYSMGKLELSQIEVSNFSMFRGKKSNRFRPIRIFWWPFRPKIL